MPNVPQYEKNVERWALFCPQEAKLLPLVELFHVEKVNNNLKVKYQQNSFLVHSQEDVYLEGEKWFESLNLRNIEILYVYGIGLGYYYPAIKQWLKESEKHFVIFLEDDLEVLRLFFEAALAEEMLNDPQVRIFYLDWNNKEAILEKIIGGFLFQGFKVSALNSYCMNKDRFKEVESLIAYFSSLKSGLMAEYITSGHGFFNNFYRNLLEIPSAGQGNHLFSQFKNIPAIICGAGPSLEKNGELLKTLSDRALIFAGGTAMNAINAQGIIPHFGVGIDPNIYHYSRIIANLAFETPFFYRNRMYHNALKTIHGDKLYITGAGGYFISDWVEKKLGISDSRFLSEGYNVINFSLSIAQALGCNPLFFVGVDLAYSQNLSYAPGIFHHAIHDPKLDFQTKSTREELILKDDIYGNPIYTLWKWVQEAMWFSQVAQDDPQLSLYNCTEGGIGFPGIPNLTLEEAVEKYLTKQYDLDGMVHAAIQCAGMPESVTKENVSNLMRELVTGLKECLVLFEEIEEEYLVMQQAVYNGLEPASNYLNSSISQLAAKLTTNPTYVSILSVFAWKFIEYTSQRFSDIDYQAHNLSRESMHVKKIDLLMQRYRFLKMTAKINIANMEEVLELQEPAALDNVLDPHAVRFPKSKEIKQPSNQIYQCENGILTIRDPEMGIDYQSPIPSKAKQQIVNYPDGTKMIEQYAINGNLHGPSSFYSEKGVLLAQSWYIEGKKQGKAWFYSLDGSLVSLLGFLQGEKEGIQRYFYSSGLPKSILHFSKGILNGDVFLLYPTGKMKRELHFVNGCREGEEKLWNEQGILLIEAKYHMNKPIGIAREWYENGNLAKEITYDQDSKRCIFRRWEEGGKPWQAELVIREDYFEKVAKQSALLTEALSQVIEELKIVSNVLPHQSREKFETINGYIRSLEIQMKHLYSVSEEMQFESGSHPDNLNEAIWKSESMKRDIQHQLDEMINRMTTEIQAIHRVVESTKKILEQQQAIEPTNEEIKKHEY